MSFFLPDEETLVANRQCLDMMMNAFVPAWTSFFLLRAKNPTENPISGVEKIQLTMIEVTGCINLLIVLLVFFIDCRKGPAVWTKIAPKIYMGLIIISYLIQPWFNIIYMIYTIYESFNSPADYLLSLWCIQANILYLCLIFTYF